MFAPGKQILGLFLPADACLSPDLKFEIGCWSCDLSSFMGSEKVVSLLFCPSISCKCGCHALSSSFYFQSETGSTNFFLRVVLFPRHDFRTRNKEEAILPSLLLFSPTPSIQGHLEVRFFYFQSL